MASASGRKIGNTRYRGPVAEKLNIPKFKSGVHEADWWDQHREEATKWLEEAVATRFQRIRHTAQKRTGDATVVNMQ